jgi:putative oxidoreductase
MLRLIQRLEQTAVRLSSAGPLLARLTVGLIFIGTGWGKLHNLEQVTSFFTELHIPAPGFHARLVAGTELVGGALVLVGLATRLAALPLAFTMVVAIATAKRAELSGLRSLVAFEEWTYLVLFVWLSLAGPGKLSLDALLIRLRRARRAPLASTMVQTELASGR